VAPATIAAPSGGAVGTITVTAQGSTCSWTASTGDTFITLTGATSGSGSGSVAFRIAQNDGGARTGSITVAGQSVSVSQAWGSCVTGISPLTKNFASYGGTAVVTVAAGTGCTWSATTDVAFITLADTAQHTGNASLLYGVAANPGSAPRQGTISIGGLPFAITQDALEAATTTFLGYASDLGDYIGHGETHRYTLADAAFSATADSNRGHVYITIIGPSYSFWWYLDLAAPAGQQLLPGTYEGAMRYPFQLITVPGLDFSGTGRGCNTLTGRFVIIEATYGTGTTVDRFHATFEQHCEGASVALRGEISIVANPWR
jgi:hypothetical protein